jgi:hypothetical protein
MIAARALVTEVVITILFYLPADKLDHNPVKRKHRGAVSPSKLDRAGTVPQQGRQTE